MREEGAMDEEAEGMEEEEEEEEEEKGEDENAITGFEKLGAKVSVNKMRLGKHDAWRLAGEAYVEKGMNREAA